jgi:N-acyl-D-aspartate/D-glutamate deacylase
MNDLVIRDGLVVDGTGRAAFRADVAIDGGTIVAVGRVDGRGRREIAADGAVVAPGWVDIHTHYDGQVTWDGVLAPSSQHGVTTAVMGNCGVGFAPARTGDGDHGGLIELMEGVEDIPGAALAEGLPWDWETFPDYLAALDRRRRTIDVGTQLPHASLRAYVMGHERGGDHEAEPTDAELTTMHQVAVDALTAGALGFASSRTANHRSRSGQFIGSLTATDRELFAIGSALGETGRGVFQFASDFNDLDAEFDLICSLAKCYHRPVSMSLAQHDRDPDRWQRVLTRIGQAAAEGIVVKGQVCSRAIGLMLSQEGTMNPFASCPTYAALTSLPVPERAARMRDPEVKRLILSEYGQDTDKIRRRRMAAFAKMFVLGNPPDYEQPAERSIANLAAARGIEPKEILYDALTAGDGRGMVYFALLNYTDSNLDTVHTMMASDHTLFGLSDGGAHVGTICDASFPTYNLIHWVRDRSRGERFSLEFVVRKQCQDNARHMGLLDRGVIANGYKADLNVIDLHGMRLHPPRFAHDLPAGGRRLLQDVTGYLYTVQTGQVTFESGEPTGAMPGALVRGARPAPAATLS